MMLDFIDMYTALKFEPNDSNEVKAKALFSETALCRIRWMQNYLDCLQLEFSCVKTNLTAKEFYRLSDRHSLVAEYLQCLGAIGDDINQQY